MKIDHIFICSQDNGDEADELVNFGLIEGSSRIHEGQGTRNRKFYFQNCFLEILWVYNEAEIRAEVTAKTKLWERSQFSKNNYSPFGLCLENSILSDPLFKECVIYQPEYFPIGKSIEIITNDQFPFLPMTFRLPNSNLDTTTQEPLDHPNGIRRLTKAVFEVDSSSLDLDYTELFKAIDHIQFRPAHKNHLILEFDHSKQHKTREFPNLNLTIFY